MTPRQNHENPQDGPIHHPARHVSPAAPDVSRTQPEGRAFGFLSDGCLAHRREMHAAYLSGELSDEECLEIDRHLLGGCLQCGNTWDALTSEYEESFPVETREEESEPDSEDEFTGEELKNRNPVSKETL